MSSRSTLNQNAVWMIEAGAFRLDEQEEK